MLNQPIGSCKFSFIQGGTVYKGEPLCVFLFRTVLRRKMKTNLDLKKSVSTDLKQSLFFYLFLFCLLSVL